MVLVSTVVGGLFLYVIFERYLKRLCIGRMISAKPSRLARW